MCTRGGIRHHHVTLRRCAIFNFAILAEFCNEHPYLAGCSGANCHLRMQPLLYQSPYVVDGLQRRLPLVRHHPRRIRSR